MRAMLLAAGRGERFRPVTDHCPKPLVEVAGQTLIERHLGRLSAAGVREVVINLGWLGGQLRQALGDGARYGLAIEYSEEGWPALETGGGLRRALPLLGEAPFLVVNSDVWTNYPIEQLLVRAATLPEERLLHLVLVPNPEHHPQGDFNLESETLGDAGERLTAAGLWLARPRLLDGSDETGPFSVVPYWRRAIAAGRASGERYDGLWADVGTPQRREVLERSLRGD